MSRHILEAFPGSLESVSRAILKSDVEVEAADLLGVRAVLKRSQQGRTRRNLSRA